MNYSRHPVHDAERFGDLVKVTEGNWDLRHTDRLWYMIEECFKKHGYDYERDYVAIMGSPVIATVVVRYLTSQFMIPHGKMKFLVFDNVARKYLRREL